MANVAIAYCSKEDCDHTVSFDRNKRDAAPKFCTQCGNKMNSSCPSCSHYRKRREDIFCYNCGNKYK